MGSTDFSSSSPVSRSTSTIIDDLWVNSSFVDNGTMTINGATTYNGNVTVNGTTTLNGSLTTGTVINGVTSVTTGIPIPTIVASYVSPLSTVAITNAIAYVPVASPGTYRLSATIANSTATNSGTSKVSVTYADANGVSITHVPPVEQTGSATLLVGATGASKNFTALGYTFTTDNSQTTVSVSTTVSGTINYVTSLILERLL